MTSTDMPESQEIIFVGAAGVVGASLRPGEEVSFSRVSDFFGRAKEDVEAEWQSMIANTQQLLTRLTTFTGDFDLDEVEIELGFSAEGKLGFIAKAGATASVTLKFSRKAATPAQPVD